MEIVDIYFNSNRLRLGIYQFDLLGEKYMALVAELQVNWGVGVSVIKKKALAKSANKDDHTQTGVIARQIRKVVETYFAKNLSALKDDLTFERHIYVATAVIVEAIYEIQMDRDRIFAPRVLNDDVEKVTVDGSYLRRRNESDEEFQIRTLRDMLDKKCANNGKLATENRGLKLELESERENKQDLRLQLEAAKAAEQAVHAKEKEALKKAEGYRRQFYDQVTKTCDQRDMYKGKLNAAEAKAATAEAERDESKRTIMHAEQQVEELLQQMSNARLHQNSGATSSEGMFPQSYCTQRMR